MHYYSIDFKVFINCRIYRVEIMSCSFYRLLLVYLLGSYYVSALIHNIYSVKIPNQLFTHLIINNSIISVSYDVIRIGGAVIP